MIDRAVADPEIRKRGAWGEAPETDHLLWGSDIQPIQLFPLSLPWPEFMSYHVFFTSLIPGPHAASGGDPVGVLWSWPPHFPAVWGSKCARTPHFLVPCCSIWLVINSIISADSGMHADFCTLNINVNFIKLFDCINCIKCLAAGERALPRPTRSPREGRKKGGLTEEERWWPQAWTPKI